MNAIGHFFNRRGESRILLLAGDSLNQIPAYSGWILIHLISEYPHDSSQSYLQAHKEDYLFIWFATRILDPKYRFGFLFGVYKDQDKQQ